MTEHFTWRTRSDTLVSVPYTKVLVSVRRTRYSSSPHSETRRSISFSLSSFNVPTHIYVFPVVLVLSVVHNYNVVQDLLVYDQEVTLQFRHQSTMSILSRGHDLPLVHLVCDFARVPGPIQSLHTHSQTFLSTWPTVDLQYLTIWSVSTVRPSDLSHCPLPPVSTHQS